MAPILRLLALLPASLCFQLPPQQRSLGPAWAPRAGAALAQAEADPGGGDDDGLSLGDELASQLRQALGSMEKEELRASDERVLDSMVDERKQAFNAVQGDLADAASKLQDELESRLEAELTSVKAEAMAKIDAAVDKLRANAAAAEPAAAAAAAAAAASRDSELDFADPRRALLTPGSRIAVVGAESELGAALCDALAASGEGWEVAALCTEPEGGAAAALGVEVRPFSPFTPSALARSLSDADAVLVLSEGACGSGGAEPKAVGRLLKALPAHTRRLLLVSTHGVDRTNALPFSMENMFGGKLDKQRALEQEALLAARKALPGHSIARFGKLKPSPRASSSSASSSASAAASSVELAPGDALSGEMSTADAAAVLVEALRRPESVNATFSAAPRSSSSPPPAAAAAIGLDDEWLKLVGPEIYRRPLEAVTPYEAASWLRDFARQLLRPGQGLPTPVTVADLPNGVLLRFVTTGYGYDSYEKEEARGAEDKWAEGDERARGNPDGALRLVAESEPSARLRVARAEMAPGTLVKETSEELLLRRLAKGIDELEVAARRSR